MIKFNDLYTEHKKIKNRLTTKFNKLFLHNDFINGKEVKKIEENLKDITGSKYAISCANGTDAIQIALMSLNLERGDEVLITAFSYVCVIEKTVLLGLKPVLVNIDYNTFNIEFNLIEKKISNKTKVIIPFHLFGQNANMIEIVKIAKKYKLFIIEDFAQSLSCDNYHGVSIKKSGTIGDFGCFYFSNKKYLFLYRFFLK